MAKTLFEKSTIKRRTTVPRTRNNGEWTEARFNSFIKGALRGAMWPPKFICIEQAFVGYGINPKTKRRCKMFACASCGNHFPQKEMKADHIEPVVPITGFTDWNTFISRLFVEAPGFQALCESCHSVKTKQEGEARKAHKNETDPTDSD